MLDKKHRGVHQPQHRILQWNANSIHGEVPLLEDPLEANNVDVVCIQETKQQPKDKTPELRNFSAVRSDRPEQGEGRVGPFDLHSKTDSLQSQPPTGQQLKHDGESHDSDSNPKQPYDHYIQLTSPAKELTLPAENRYLIVRAPGRS